MKKALLLSLMAALFLSACSENSASTVTPDLSGENQSLPSVEAAPVNIEVEIPQFKDDDLTIKTAADTKISLADNNITVNGSGAEASDNIIKITKAGVYEISGELSNGQIIVEAASEDKVYLLLGGVNVTSDFSAPLLVNQADKVVITLMEGTQNTFTDSANTQLDENSEPDACIFSKDDLVINGSGALVVNSNFNDGITSKDDLRIISGEITVTSVGDGIKGKDCVAINSGKLDIQSNNDGIKSTNTEEKGYVYIKYADVTINSVSDGIQAESYIYVDDGDFNIVTNGGADNAPVQSDRGFGGGWDMSYTQDEQTEQSNKALKAQTGLYIQNGTFLLDSYDDALHSDGEIVINGSDIVAKSGDDGVHAESSFEITNGTLTIEKSYEGIESAIITLSGGYVDITASDDGLNATNGSGESFGFGFGGQEEDLEQVIYFNGTNLIMDAGGDGIDSNGSVKMNAGTIIVYGPTNSANGALDYGATFDISGGTLLAVGAQGMSMTPSSTSAQPFINAIGSFSAGSEVTIEDENKNVIFSVTVPKAFQSVVFSSPDLQLDKTYKVIQGDTTATAIASTQQSGMGGFGGGMGGGFGGGGDFAGGGRDPMPDDIEIPEGFVPQKPENPLFK